MSTALYNGEFSKTPSYHKPKPLISKEPPYDGTVLHSPKKVDSNNPPLEISG